ncbi:MAG: nucleoid-associated protein [Bacteroidetes bacterium]|nr:MAG: nucleoid-associated protein [Bacteroidota bacterium]
MTNLNSIELTHAIVHRIGNPSRGEALKLSAAPLTLNDALVRSMMLKYFLQGINPGEQYAFTHLSNVALNEVYHYALQIFDEPQLLTAVSQQLAQFLYSKSTHVRVKEGELYVALLHNVPLDQGFFTALGIFKSETKDSFLKVLEHGQNLEVVHEEGAATHKLDKGCLIFNTNRAEGLVACVVDNTNKQQDAQYWVNSFLQVQPIANNYLLTQATLDCTKQFVQQAYPNQFNVTRADQIELMERSLDYFKTNDSFDANQFATEVLHHDAVITAYNGFKDKYANAHGAVFENSFDIENTAVAKQAKTYKSIIKLDKNFHVYIHGRRDLIERGYDEATGKQYYKLYFDEEA